VDAQTHAQHADRQEKELRVVGVEDGAPPDEALVRKPPIPVELRLLRLALLGDYLSSQLAVRE
jgi:hypothetical protein